MATTRLKRTPSSTGTRTKFTYSAWIKRGSLAYAPLMSSWSANTDAGYLSLRFPATGELDCTGWSTAWFNTNRKFRDTNGWYHIVLSVDSTLATAGDRMKLYVNGVQETSFTSKNNPSQNQEFPFSHSGTPHFIGVQFYAGSTYSHYYDGSMSHVHFIDGTAYPASTFGSTDSTTGEWKINTSPSVSYGTNGFFILKDGNSVTDQSGQSNNLTVDNGTLTKTEDCPSNVFCTLNPLSTDSGVTLSSGNTESDYDGSVGHAKGTLGFSSGKFYWEVKIATAASNYPMLGIGNLDAENMQKPTGGSYPGGFTGSYGAYGNGNVYANGSNTGSQSFTWSTNDIIGIAVDLDSGTKTIKWYKNGNATAIASTNITTDGPFASMDYNGGEAAVNLQYNFGNGYFGTTAVSSAGTNASGNGIFEYDVPTGYTALSTKGLNL